MTVGLITKTAPKRLTGTRTKGGGTSWMGPSGAARGFPCCSGRVRVTACGRFTSRIFHGIYLDTADWALSLRKGDYGNAMRLGHGTPLLTRFLLHLLFRSPPPRPAHTPLEVTQEEGGPVHGSVQTARTLPEAFSCLTLWMCRRCLHSHALSWTLILLLIRILPGGVCTGSVCALTLSPDTGPAK